MCISPRLPSTVTASHVSRHWRRVVLNSPILWTCIQSRPLNSPHMTSYPLALLDAHLERSRTCLLDIQYDVSMEAHLDKLVSSVHRWRSFTLADTCDYTVTTSVLECLALCMRRLFAS
ncbi:hypothetical protein PLICRDRAFT_475265 [Plicaturopsis crispa FD-325 SS-3]|nr:hypothetical protein PLICRDRAFT_475265 [Plicaturopsis crispa FD-325 SS-3]